MFVRDDDCLHNPQYHARTANNVTAMDASPLTRQTRPETFLPKIVHLYETVLNAEDSLEPSEGFWREFFLLPPDKERLQDILDTLTADDLLHLQVRLAM